MLLMDVILDRGVVPAGVQPDNGFSGFALE